MTPAELRRAIATAATDDLAHGQPELETRNADRGTDIIEVRGFIDRSRHGIFAADQLTRVFEARHPGLLATLNGAGPAAITQADIERAIIDGDGKLSAMARSVLELIQERTPYRPSFTDL